MGQLIKNEQEKLELVLSTPGHPKTQAYLRDYQNALFEELAFELDVIHTLKEQYFVSIREEAQLLRAIKDKEDQKYEKHLHQLTMMKTHESAISMPAQQQVLRDTLAKLEAKRDELLAQYEAVKKEEEKKITEIDQRWTKRQDEFQADFMEKLKEKNIQVKDINGNVIPLEKFEELMKLIPQPPSLNTLLGPDLIKALAPVVMPGGKPDEVGLKQMAVMGQVHKQIKMLWAMCPDNGEEKHSDVIAVKNNNSELLQQDFDMAFLPQEAEGSKEPVTHINQDAKDIGEVFAARLRIDHCKKKVVECEEKIQEAETKLDRVTAVVGEAKPQTPSPKKDFNPTK